jgi:hypothetical protein
LNPHRQPPGFISEVAFFNLLNFFNLKSKISNLKSTDRILQQSFRLGPTIKLKDGDRPLVPVLMNPTLLYWVKFDCRAIH